MNSAPPRSRARNGWPHLQRREQERTGIKSLKVRYNQVFGYYIEISTANLGARAGRLHAQADAWPTRSVSSRPS